MKIEFNDTRQSLNSVTELQPKVRFYLFNVPYGLKRNSKNQWIAFNREYLPLGWNSDEDVTKTVGHNDIYCDMPLYTSYPNLTETLLKKIAWGEDGIKRDENGNIKMVFLYGGGHHPRLGIPQQENYFQRILLLSELRKQEKR
jgi:hypothetical protein